MSKNEIASKDKVMMPIRLEPDLYQKMMEEHILSGKIMTVAYKNCSNELDKFTGLDKMNFSEDGKYLKYFPKTT